MVHRNVRRERDMVALLILRRGIPVALAVWIAREWARSHPVSRWYRIRAIIILYFMADYWNDLTDLGERNRNNRPWYLMRRPGTSDMGWD